MTAKNTDKLQQISITALTVCAVLLSCCGLHEHNAEQLPYSDKSISLSAENVFDIDSFTNAVDEFDWVSYDNKPCLTANMFANECRVFISDINSDNNPEILLTDIYSPREANYTEVFSFTDGSLKSDGGFWGYVFSENEKTQIYQNSANESVFISDTETTHGGKTIRTVSEVTVTGFDETLKFITVFSDNNSEAECYQCDIEAEITRDFLDGGFDAEKFIRLTKEEYDRELSAYTDSLTEQYEASSSDCGFLSIGNYPPSEMMSDPHFDYTYHIEHKDEPYSIETANQKTADSIKQKLSLLYKNKS